VDSNGQRLDERTLFRGDARRQPEQPGGVPADKVGEGAAPTLRFVSLETMEGLPGPTEHARSARPPVTDGVYRDQVADANRASVGMWQRHHLASDFVALGEGLRLGALEILVQVGSAHARRHDADQRAITARCRNIAHVDFTKTVLDGSSHASLRVDEILMRRLPTWRPVGHPDREHRRGLS
jgi:hypothetical protein